MPTRACIWGEHIPCLISAMNQSAHLLHVSDVGRVPSAYLRSTYHGQTRIPPRTSPTIIV
eukprot:1157450-Pelagomonas_calceolata.AAC.8